MKFYTLDPNHKPNKKKKEKREVVRLPNGPEKGVLYVMRPGGYFSVIDKRHNYKSQHFNGLPHDDNEPEKGVYYVMRPGGYFSVHKKKPERKDYL